MTIEKAIAKRARAHQAYMLDGKRVPSVTTVLGVLNKPALVKWANNLGLKGVDSTSYVDEAARIGTLAHELIQEYLGGPKVNKASYTREQLDQAENAAISFYEWERVTNHKMQTTAIEWSLVSSQGYGGTVDWYGLIDGRPWLVDIKTCGKLYPEHEYQVAAYWMLLQENKVPVEGVRLLRVGRSEDEGFDDHVIARPKLATAAEVFKDALKLYRDKQAHEKAINN